MPDVPRPYRFSRVLVTLALGIVLGPASVARAEARSPAATGREPDVALAVASERELMVFPQGGTRTIRQAFALGGLPVRGAFETVRVDAAGVRHVVGSRRPVAPPQLGPEQARVDPASLPRRVADALELPAVPQLAAAPELVYVLVLEQPVLAWEVQLPLSLRPEPTRRRVWISAATGRLLREEEAVFSSRARIFAENPSKTPDPIEIELHGVHAGGPGVKLSSERLRSLNCLAEEPDGMEPWWEEGECYPAASVTSDAHGDFFVPLPDIVHAGDNVQGEDLYAELSMFAHAELFFARMEALGAPGFRCEQATLIANFRDLEASSTLSFSPLNNAFYTGECDPERGPTMLFGQGSEVDFGYDGDVIYHELGHGMVSHLSPDGLTGRAMRADGLHNDARALNEAFADYFSLMVTGDPELGEYVGRFWASNSKPYIRTAENEKVCPTHTIGQEHNDGEPFAAALWATRRRAADPEAVDRMFLEGLARLPNDATLDGTGQVMLEVADELVAEGTMAAETAEVLYRALQARGLVDCPRWITDPREIRGGRKLYLSRVTDAVTPFWPSPMQVRYVVPEGADDLVVQLVLKAGKASDPVEGRVLLKRGDPPISYTYDLAATDEVSGDPDDESDAVREVVLVRGDWDEELELSEITESEFRASRGGLQPGEVVYVTVVDAGTATLTASDFRVYSSVELAEDEEGGTGTTGGGSSTGDDASEQMSTGAAVSACACTAPGRRRFGGAPWAAGLVLLAAARRRRW